MCLSPCVPCLGPENKWGGSRKEIWTGWCGLGRQGSGSESGQQPDMGNDLDYGLEQEDLEKRI